MVRVSVEFSVVAMNVECFMAIKKNIHQSDCRDTHYAL